MSLQSDSVSLQAKRHLCCTVQTARALASDLLNRLNRVYQCKYFMTALNVALSKVCKRQGHRVKKAELGALIVTTLARTGVIRLHKRNHIPRRSFSFHRYAEELGESYFRCLYRMSRTDLYYLQSKLQPQLERFQTRPQRKHPAVDVLTMLAITIRHLAGAQCLDLGWPYGIGTATV